jgi:RNA polymerase sigma-70 factor (ECF subfamily)
VARTRRGTDSELDIDDEEQVHNINELKGLDTPEQMLLNDEIIETIKSAIEKLPEEMRIAITLREFEGMSYEEIAEAMDCPVGTVRSRIFRAREAIDSKLNPLLG